MVAILYKKLEMSLDDINKIIKATRKKKNL